MESVIDFGKLLTGRQYLPEREKIILMALINASDTAQNGDLAKIERLVGMIIIAARAGGPARPTRKPGSRGYTGNQPHPLKCSLERDPPTPE